MNLQKLEILDTLWHTKRATLDGISCDAMNMPCVISSIDRDQALTDGDSGDPVYPLYALNLQVWDGFEGWAQDDDKPRAIHVIFTADEMRELAASW